MAESINLLSSIFLVLLLLLLHPMISHGAEDGLQGRCQDSPKKEANEKENIFIKICGSRTLSRKLNSRNYVAVAFGLYFAVAVFWMVFGYLCLKSAKANSSENMITLGASNPNIPSAMDDFDEYGVMSRRRIRSGNVKHQGKNC